MATDAALTQAGACRAAIVLLATGLLACSTRQPDETFALDPRTVLASRLTHGLGDDILDSPLAQDSINAGILVSARHGVDSSDLRKQLPPSDSTAGRIRALVAAHLIQRDGPLLRAALPMVLGPDRVWYDSVTRTWATAALQSIQAPLDTLLQQLVQKGWRDWSYHFVWSQVFDSQRLWAIIQRAAVTPPLVPAITWVVFPDHPNKTGTNLFPGRVDTPWYLAVTWTPVHQAQLGPLEVAADTFIAVVTGRPISDSSRHRLVDLGLLGSDGKPTVPILRPHDDLLNTVRSLADTWARAVRQALHPQVIAQRLRLDPRVAWAMAYHDLSWSAMAELIARGQLAPFPSSAQSLPAHGSAALIPADPLFVGVLTNSLSGRPQA